MTIQTIAQDGKQFCMQFIFFPYPEGFGGTRATRGPPESPEQESMPPPPTPAHTMAEVIWPGYPELQSLREMMVTFA